MRLDGHHWLRGIGRALGSAALVVFGALPAAGQIDASVALGGGVAFYQPVDDLADGFPSFAFVYRFGKPEGFRPTIGFEWHGTDFDTIVEGQRVELGQLRVRPIMVGYGYYVKRGRVLAGTTLVGGYSFNSFDTADAARLAYDRDRDELLLRVDASNSLAWRAELNVWYDLTSHLGLTGSFGYVAARPKAAIVTDVGEESRQLRSDAIKFQVGIAYGIF